MTANLQSLGAMGVACDKLARMVALSTTFQAATQTANYAQARKKVYRKNVVGIAKPPFAIVSQGSRHEQTMNAGGDRNYFVHGGQLALSMYIETPREYWSDNILAETWADNFFTRTITDVAELANADDPVEADRVVANEGHLDIRHTDRTTFDETEKEKWKTIGRFWFAFYSVDWGGS